jgi:hypothetical protein
MNKNEIYTKILSAEEFGYCCIPIVTLKKWFVEKEENKNQDVILNNI